MSKGKPQIALLNMKEDRKLKYLFSDKFSTLSPKISPDGKWLAYVSDEEGQEEVYVSSFPDVNNERLKLSVDGGYMPLWSPDGGKLFYRNGNKVMAASVKTDNKIIAEKPEVLFEGEYFINSISYYVPTWDIHPDGKRFIMIKPGGTEADKIQRNATKVNVVLNWFEELKNRVPVD
jgi:dipeptidyl aminopeptidase/acylaminoacyl peptidase